MYLFLLKNIDCGYSLEPPRRGGSNVYPQSMFWAEIWRISEFLSEIFQFLKVNFSIYLNRHLFVMDYVCMVLPLFFSHTMPPCQSVSLSLSLSLSLSVPLSLSYTLKITHLSYRKCGLYPKRFLDCSLCSYASQCELLFYLICHCLLQSSMIHDWCLSGLPIYIFTITKFKERRPIDIRCRQVFTFGSLSDFSLHHAQFKILRIRTNDRAEAICIYIDNESYCPFNWFWVEVWVQGMRK